MSITNQSKPTSSISNSTKINIGEVWDTDLNTWNAESRTWNDMQSKINNSIIGVSGYLWSIKRFPWLETTPWLSEGGITNQSKPI